MPRVASTKGVVGRYSTASSTIWGREPTGNITPERIHSGITTRLATKPHPPEFSLDPRWQSPEIAMGIGSRFLAEIGQVIAKLGLQDKGLANLWLSEGDPRVGAIRA